MSDEPDSDDLAYVNRALDHPTTGVASLRVGMAVQTAISMCQDATPTTLLTELRPMHGQHARPGKQARDLEVHTP